MIKNVVFDYGNVMIHFDPRYMVSRYVSDANDVEMLTPIIFDRLYWDALDEGSISDGEVVEAVKKRIPERFWDVSEKIYYNWVYNLPEMEGMNALVKHVKDELGARVFLLSNISIYFAEHAHEKRELDVFEKCIFSSVVGHIKPHADMFEYICRECGIEPEETLFVDDNENNIKGAEAFGIKGYLFDGDSKKLRKYIDSLFE